jgi:hypothetical protein
MKYEHSTPPQRGVIFVADEFSTKRSRCSAALYYFISFTFFLLDQKETKNQGHKNPPRLV